MKALKKESTVFINEIITATANFAQKEDTTSTDILELYNVIGKAISEQGEKAFIPHLVNILADKFPKLKGFSPRNLRRMREFYNTYKDRADLLNLTKELSWTINSVILENCDNYDEYEFYLKLAIAEDLSKLKLLAAISDKAHQAQTEEQASDCVELCGDFKMSEAYTTKKTVKHKFKAFVTRCGYYIQGSDPPSCLLSAEKMINQVIYFGINNRPLFYLRI